MDLPKDLVVQILSRFSAASLARLRSVSKEWNDLIIKDERLAKKHSATTIMLIDFRVYLARVKLHQIDNNKVKIISQFSLKDPLSINSLGEVDIFDVFHCDGLLLCFTKDNRLVVWNPCSGETRWIQPRNFYNKLDYFALSKSSCNKYKILRMEQRGHWGPTSFELEIYDFNSNSWRVIGNTRDWYIPRIKRRGMSVKGNTYWLANSDQENHRKGEFLLSFDFSTERFGRVSLPVDLLSHNAMTLSVTREDQQLCLLASRCGVYGKCSIDVWIADEIESNGAASWSKFLSVDLRFCFSYGMNFLVDQENKVLVCRGKPGVSNNFLHVIGEDKCIQVHHNDAESRCSLVLSYVPTLVHIQQGI